MGLLQGSAAGDDGAIMGETPGQQQTAIAPAYRAWVSMSGADRRNSPLGSTKNYHPTRYSPQQAPARAPH
ncbi:hypothetical protein DZC75_06750 [Pseudomonas parafulva]|uniref:Uncharacterized protein n=1 Tax=Pseudomonas parafulva TaxID=157782 RepID=A0AAI8K7Q9_9PSED|nr:hypothetical protein DZC75_06750 [Pseudomonas parafulva]